MNTSVGITFTYKNWTSGFSSKNLIQNYYRGDVFHVSRLYRQFHAFTMLRYKKNENLTILPVLWYHRPKGVNYFDFSIDFEYLNKHVATIGYNNNSNYTLGYGIILEHLLEVRITYEFAIGRLLGHNNIGAYIGFKF